MVPKAAVLLLIAAGLAYAMLALTLGVVSLVRLRRVPDGDGRTRLDREEPGTTSSNVEGRSGSTESDKSSSQERNTGNSGT